MLRESPVTTTPSVFSTALAYCQMPLATLAVAVACGVVTRVLEKSPFETMVTSGAIAVAAATMLSVPALTSDTLATWLPVASVALAYWPMPLATVALACAPVNPLRISIGVDVDRRLGQDDRGRSALRDGRLRDRGGDGGAGERLAIVGDGAGNCSDID